MTTVQTHDPAAEPLIYTTEGNVPIKSLTLKTRWEVTDDYIKVIPEFYNAEGKLVRNDAHVFAKKGLPTVGAVQANVG